MKKFCFFLRFPKQSNFKNITMAGKKTQPEKGRRSTRLKARSKQTAPTQTPTPNARQTRKRKTSPKELGERETLSKRLKQTHLASGIDNAKKGKGKAADRIDEQPPDDQDHDHDHDKSQDGKNVRNVLDAHTRNLLPASWFGSADDLWARGVWSLEKENAMREMLEASPQYARFLAQQTHFYSVVEPSGAYLEAELRLAEILQHRYRCNLDDLFRYGLRPDVDSGTTKHTAHPYASQGYLVKLAVILVHPMWNGISVVRWMLQRVVQERVPGHARPLVPPASYWKLPFVSVAREWGAAVAVASEKAEIKAKGKGKGIGKDSEAAESAADAAEAELAWFTFVTDTPRDLWMLDEMLQHDEPGYDEDNGSDADDEDSRSVASYDSGDSSLTVCSAIKEGRFGQISGSFSECEITLRQDKLRREDHLTARTRGFKRTPNVVSADMADEQVFFNLQERDLDRLLGMLGDPQFMVDSGSALPRAYYNGYIRTHNLLGHGDGHKSDDASKDADTDPKEQPLLTCSRCAQEFHQGTRHPSDVDVNKDGHVHFLHQEFVRDNPARMFDWLRQSKLEWLATGVREALINVALREDASKTSRQESHLQILPDVPPCDPVPMGHLDKVFTHPSQLEVMHRASLGNRPHSAVLWCLQGQWNE